MEASSSTSHFRSVSLPSRLTTPFCTKTETKVNELKALGNMVANSETIQSGLVGLAEMYVCMDEHVRSPQTQQALSRSRHGSGTLVQDALDWSIELLDLCSSLKDLLLLMRENMQILQSALRRKATDSEVATHIAAYLRFRKKTKKNVTKSLGTLKHLEKKMGSFLFVDVDQNVSTVTKVLGGVYSLTISQFRSILLFVSTKTNRTNPAQLISKLVSKGISTHNKHEMVMGEMETIDMVMTSMQKSACNSDSKINTDVQRRLHLLDASLGGFEDGLDCLFRRLIKSRASLLNLVVC